MIAIVIAVFALSFFLTLTISSFILSKTRLSNISKKWCVTAIVSLLCFPTITPVVIGASIPLPNILTLIMFLYAAKPLMLMKLYLYGWKLFIPSLLIIALITRGIAAMIFYENPHKE